MASIKVSLLGDERSLVRSFKKSTKAAEQFNRSMLSTGRGTGRVRSALRSFGPALGVGGVAAGFVGAVKAAGSFDRAMRNVNTNAKLGEADLGKLSRSVLSLAGRTAQAPETLAKGLYDITSSGFSAKDAIKILAVTSKAATAGLTDTATSSKAIVAGLNAYHLSADSAGKVSDILFTTVQKGVLSFEELAQNMGDLVPAAAPLGVRLEEVGAAIATVTLQGVPAAEAATRVKNTMLQLAKPSANLKKLFKEQGFESGEAAVKALGFSGVLELIQKKTKGNVTATAALTPEIRALLGVVGITGKNLATYQSNLRAMENAQRGAGATAGAFAEQSKSAGVKFQKLGAQLKVLQVQLGNALLPSVLKVTGAMSAWLSKTQNTQKILGALKSTVEIVGSVLAALRAAFRGLNTVTGNTKNTVKLLIGAYIAFKALAMASAITRIASSFTLLRTQTVAATAATELNTAAQKINTLSSLGTTAGGAATFKKLGPLTTVGTSATVAAGKVSKLKGLLRGLSAQPVIPITIAAVVLMNKKPIDNFLKGHGLGALGRNDKGLIKLWKEKVFDKSIFGKKNPKFEGPGSIGGLQAFLGRTKPKTPKSLFGKASNADTRVADAALTKEAADLKVAKAKAKVNFEQRNQFFDALIGRRLDRVQDIGSASGQVSALGKIAAQITKRIASTKDVTRKLTLEDQLLGIVRQQRDLRKQIRDDAETALTDGLQLNLARAEATVGFGDDLAALAKIRKHILARIKSEGSTTALQQQLFDNQQAANAKRKDAAEAKTAKTAASQFFTLGLDATGGERVPFKKNLSRQLGTVTDAVKGTFLDTPKTQKLLARIRKVLRQGIVPTDVRAKIKEMLAGVNDELKNGAGNRTKFRVGDADNILAGLGLSPKQLKLARQRLSTVGAGGRVPAASRRGAFAVATAAPLVINIDGRRDDAETVARKVTEAQRKHGKRNTTQRRGR